METKDILNHYFEMLEVAIDVNRSRFFIRQIVKVIEEISILNAEKVDYKRINSIQFKES